MSGRPHHQKGRDRRSGTNGRGSGRTARLRSRDEIAGANALAAAVLQLIEQVIPAEALDDGHRYARQGQVAPLTIGDGDVRADVQGTLARPYTTVLRFGAYGPIWNDLIQAMATEAMYLVKLRDGELPESLTALLEKHGLRLLPDVATSIEMDCNCPIKGPCKHLAAVGYLLAEALARDVLTVLTLRGMPAEQLLSRIQQARVIRALGMVTAHPDPRVPEAKEAPPPLETCLDTFWRPGRPLSELLDAPPPQHVPHALLRRLGPSPLEGRFPMVGLLASVYDTVTAYAEQLRDRAEHLIDQDSDDGGGGGGGAGNR